VAAARSSQVPAGALDTPDRLLDLDGHAWTVGSGADGPDRRATANARRDSPHHGTAATAAVPPLAKPRTSRASPTRESLAPSSSSSSARHSPSLATAATPATLHPSCFSPPSSRLPPPRLPPCPSRLGPPHPISQASRGRGVQRVSGGHPFLEAQAWSEI
jgi:hypothetical protein